MRRLRIAAWQMVRGRVRDMALRSIVERGLHQIVKGGLSEQHAVETPSLWSTTPTGSALLRVSSGMPGSRKSRHAIRGLSGTP